MRGLVFPLLFKVVLFAVKTKRGRRLLFLGGRHAARLARSDQARRAYAQAWRIALHPRTRKAAGKAATVARSASGGVKPWRRPKRTGLRRAGHTVAGKAAAIPTLFRR